MTLVENGSKYFLLLVPELTFFTIESNSIFSGFSHKYEIDYDLFFIFTFFPLFYRILLLTFLEDGRSFRAGSLRRFLCRLN